MQYIRDIHKMRSSFCIRLSHRNRCNSIQNIPKTSQVDTSIDRNLPRHANLPKWQSFLGSEQVTEGIADLELFQHGSKAAYQVSDIVSQQQIA